MRKEVIIAILTGSALGLVIAFGVWRANQAFQSTLKNGKQKIQETLTTKDDKKSFDLTLASPENLSISTQSSVEIQGLTRPNTYIVLSTQTVDEIVEADGTGAFKVDVDLDGGVNLLKITSLDPANGTSEKSLTLIYSSEFKKFLTSDSEKEDDKEATTEAETIREKVSEKIAEASVKSTSYLGLITDITDKTVQIKDDAGEIQQISLTDETEYVKLSTETKTLSKNELAIGDYIAALGFKSNSKVLDAKRILVTTKAEEVKFSPIFGQILTIGKKDLTLKDNEEKEWKVEFAKKWAGPNLTEVETGQKVIVVGNQSETTLSGTRTLYIIEVEE